MSWSSRRAALETHATQLRLVGGSQYIVLTVDIDGRNQPSAFSATSGVSVDGTDLTSVADDAVLFACAAPGCYRFDAGTRHLQFRVFAPQGQQRSIR